MIDITQRESYCTALMYPDRLIILCNKKYGLKKYNLLKELIMLLARYATCIAQFITQQANKFC